MTWQNWIKDGDDVVAPHSLLANCCLQEKSTNHFSNLQKIAKELHDIKDAKGFRGLLPTHIVHGGCYWSNSWDSVLVGVRDRSKRVV